MNRLTMPPREKVIPGRRTHVHPGCGHGCACYNSATPDCRRCQTEAFNAAMAKRHYEDSLTTEELLERRA